jgi:hypothetical protein
MNCKVPQHTVLVCVFFVSQYQTGIHSGTVRMTLEAKKIHLFIKCPAPDLDPVPSVHIRIRNTVVMLGQRNRAAATDSESQVKALS